MEIKKVGVLGCGLMGSGIAQVCATAGFDVTVLEVEQKFLDKGFAGIEKSLAKFAERPVEKGGITGGAEDCDPRAAERDDEQVRSRGLRHHHRGHHRKCRAEKGDVFIARWHREERCDLCFEYFFDFGDGTARPR